VVEEFVTVARHDQPLLSGVGPLSNGESRSMTLTTSVPIESERDSSLLFRRAFFTRTGIANAPVDAGQDGAE
jgi:hypothetical protein